MLTKLLPASGFRQVLAESDFVVVLLPLTPETDKLICEAEMKLMKPTAYLVNVSWGGIVDETARIHLPDVLSAVYRTSMILTTA